MLKLQQVEIQKTKPEFENGLSFSTSAHMLYIKQSFSYLDLHSYECQQGVNPLVAKRSQTLQTTEKIT